MVQKTVRRINITRKKDVSKSSLPHSRLSQFSMSFPSVKPTWSPSSTRTCDKLRFPPSHILLSPPFTRVTTRIHECSTICSKLNDQSRIVVLDTSSCCVLRGTSLLDSLCSVESHRWMIKTERNHHSSIPRSTQSHSKTNWRLRSCDCLRENPFPRLHNHCSTSQTRGCCRLRGAKIISCAVLNTVEKEIRHQFFVLSYATSSLENL